MSTISDALKKAKEVFYLIEIDFEGLVRRYSTKNITLDGDRMFEAILMNQFVLGSSFNLTSMTYSLQNISTTIANKDRLQDEEIRRRLDGSTGSVYIWCDGLTWANISSAGKLLKGQFQKKGYDKYQFNFSLAEQPRMRFPLIPPITINTDTWVNHRVATSAGSTAGLPEQIVFGDWPRGVPVLVVDNSGPYIYIAMAGWSKSLDAEYIAGTEFLFDIDDNVLAHGDYVFYPDSIDEQGNPCATFVFPLKIGTARHCSIRGLVDNEGVITGTAGTLIEHPSDIVYYLLTHYTTMGLLDEIDIESLKTMRERLPGLKFASIINSQTDVMNVIDRILYQCQYSRIQRGGRVGVVGLHTDYIDLLEAKRWGQIGRTTKVSSTPDTDICNKLTTTYNLNPFTKKYESEFILDRTNNDLCRKSYFQNQERPPVVLNLPDVQNEATAIVLANRYLELHAFRHDIVERETTLWEGFNVLEGDTGLLACEEGSSQGGAGWADEPCVLMDRKFTKNTINQRWWRVST